MTKLREIYKCEVCGNIVEVVHEGAGTLVCCGKPMVLQKENSVDASLEKHIPVIEFNEEGVSIKVGSVPHPMIPEHYIEWIEIYTDNGTSKKFLKPGDKPEVKFALKTKNIGARAYCNLHGLWKSK
ncbi:Superoxide reductase [uncultured archaeon]|nr:Superoxide reductase [uncultured archaeon]